MGQELRAEGNGALVNSLIAWAQQVGLALELSAVLKPERVWLCPERRGHQHLWSLCPVKAQEPSWWTPGVRNHPGLGIGSVAGTGLVDCTGARESLGSLA